MSRKAGGSKWWLRRLVHQGSVGQTASEEIDDVEFVGGAKGVMRCGIVFAGAVETVEIMAKRWRIADWSKYRECMINKGR